MRDVDCGWRFCNGEWPRKRLLENSRQNWIRRKNVLAEFFVLNSWPEKNVEPERRNREIMHSIEKRVFTSRYGFLTDNDEMYFLTRSTFYNHYQNTFYSCFIVVDKEYVQDTEHMFVTWTLFEQNEYYEHAATNRLKINKNFFFLSICFNFLFIWASQTQRKGGSFCSKFVPLKSFETNSPLDPPSLPIRPSFMFITKANPHWLTCMMLFCWKNQSAVFKKKSKTRTTLDAVCKQFKQVWMKGKSQNIRWR